MLSPTPEQVLHLVAGKWTKPKSKHTYIHSSPYHGGPLALVSETTPEEVDTALQASHRAFELWKKTPIKERCQYLFRFREFLHKELTPLADLASSESGKTPEEARQGLLKGIEVLEFALSLQNIDLGHTLEVSRGVLCSSRREPLGVVLGITPFNFPAMVPLWMYPIALALGNTFVLKPSEKVALTSQKIGELLLAAGLPPGVFTILSGGKTTVKALTEHPLTKAVAFVGSTPVAQSVYRSATALGKRALCLGGAKNLLILLPDADPEIAVSGIVQSFTGCAGQRCMAGSLLIAVGPTEHLIAKILDRASQITCGQHMGALIDQASKHRISEIIKRAEKAGAKIRLDGREPTVPDAFANGSWIGPTILDQVKPDFECAKEEIFGPVLSIVRVGNISEALEIESALPFGNATSVFTSQAALAKHVTDQSDAGMIGINVGVPVPREPFSFGGTKQSKFGHGDITGLSSVEFWTSLKKITAKWALATDESWMS